MHLKQIAFDKGFKDAWSDIVEPWLAPHPELQVRSGGAARGHWTAPASVSHAMMDEPTACGHQLAELKDQVHEVRADLRKLLAQSVGNAANRSTGQSSHSARPSRLWAAPAGAPEVLAPSAEPEAIVPAPPDPPKIDDKNTGGVSCRDSLAVHGVHQRVDGLASGSTAPP